MKNIIRYAFITGSFLTLTTSVLQAQTTSVQLPTEMDSSSSFRVLNSTGITRMQVNADGALYLGGAYATGVIPIEGMGIRMMWYPTKAAFRAGRINGTQWDNANIGDYSMAMGYNTNASGNASTAMGYSTTASGIRSTAMGYYATASGDYSTAMGYNTTASENYSTAMGYNTTASGIASTAMGRFTTANGGASTAMGRFTIADGEYSTAMGNYVKTNHTGAYIIGDISKTTYDSSSADNQVTMRFAGGYRLFSNAVCSTGVYMSGGISGWTNYCDRNRKENFHSIDGEQILSKIKEMPITEWNYKGTDASVKYIGPVAQDFYSAFHLGGTDSLGINSICIDGINIAAIQALEKRTTELNNALNELKAEREKTVQLHVSFDELKKEIAKMKGDIQSLTESKTGQTDSDLTLNTIHKGNEK